jgi:XRE family transcriptional regulator, regulator of sulfur utilization
MQRVHRSLSRDEVESLREELVKSVPRASTDIPQLMRTMRLITRKSQIEYAKLCGVAPRVLADIEAGKGRPTVETLQKLLRPFGYRVGIVASFDEDGSGTSVDRERRLSTNEVAERLNVNPVSVRKWAARGLLRSLTTADGQQQYLPSDVEELARHRGLTLVPRGRRSG